MKENEFLDGVSNIEADVVERFISMDNKLQSKENKPKSKGIWLRFGAVAASFLLIISAMVYVPMLWEDDPTVLPTPDTEGIQLPQGTVGGSEYVQGTEATVDTGEVMTPNNSYTPVIFDAMVSPEKLSGSNLEFIVGSSVSVSGGTADSCPPKFEFSSGIAVKARVVKNHPDKYYKLDVSSEYIPTAYRLIQMETVEVLYGENIPQYFLYLIPDYVYVDMSVYDSLLIAMSQLGMENYVLKNATKNQMESFELPIFNDYQDHPELGNIIAFSDGVFDESLWQNYTWLYGYQFVRDYLDNPETGNLVVLRGDSESTVISAINKQFNEWYGDNYQGVSVITPDSFKTQAAKDAIEYVKPFVNGVFSQMYQPYSGNGQLIFRRYINGCQTEETIVIDLLTEEVTYSEVRYTKEDMAHMENISEFLFLRAKEFEVTPPIPLRIDTEGKKLLCLNMYAWYVKVDDRLYGVVKHAWRYQEEDNYFIQYYDDMYTLFDMTSEPRAILRDDLVKIVGTRNVYMGKYGVGFEIPM